MGRPGEEEGVVALQGSSHVGIAFRMGGIGHRIVFCKIHLGLHGGHAASLKHGTL